MNNKLSVIYSRKKVDSYVHFKNKRATLIYLSDKHCYYLSTLKSNKNVFYSYCD